ncbi:hypothetical protein [Xanthovirga aplysinae]|uniref:hypothetical protein n=1 Tax=Xanthovirga aplysinae TaxID=2529853 RepID=UPI0012BD07BC|nr:hypothetical protein [Xanthovirga aplysinae]MTI31883.1 hypothetical protein [Xanthovirga aplysinae]
MLKFTIVEGINKVLGLFLTAIISRLLTQELFAEFLYYQTIFSYLLVFSILSSDYKFLVNYKINKSFLGSPPFYQTLFIRGVFVLLILVISPFFILYYDRLAFWPYMISIAGTVILFTFIMYVEGEKQKLMKYRFWAQVISILFVLVFYFNWLSPYFITSLQAFQNLFLTIGVFFVAKKYIAPYFKWKSFVFAIQNIKWKVFLDLLVYFFIRNFIFFITTIEVLILSFLSLEKGRNVFVEGLRLANTLLPFAIFYIAFNINKFKKNFFKVLTAIALLNLFLAPFFVFLLFGTAYISKVYFYNFFLLTFLFSAMMEKEFLSFLTLKNDARHALLYFNLTYFIFSTVFVFLNLSLGISDPLSIIILYTLKLLIYYVLLIVRFKLPQSIKQVLIAFSLVLALNFGLERFGYYRKTHHTINVVKNEMMQLYYSRIGSTGK